MSLVAMLLWTGPALDAFALSIDALLERVRRPDRNEPSRVVVVCKVGAPEFAREVAVLVHEVRRIKAAT